MNKPESYDEVKSQGEFTPVELGGHYCTIKQVSETKTKNGDDMIVVLFDFAPNDKQCGYFTDAFQSDVRDGKKWPFQGSKYIVVNDYKDKTKVSKNFKTFCECVERSNNGFKIQWGGEWGKQFTNKKVGVVYGLEENEFDGKSFMRPAVKWFCKFDAVESANIPEPKYLKKAAEDPVVFTEVVDTEDTELPF